MSLGTAYRLLGRPADAITELQVALKLNPRSSRALIGLATSHGNLKQWKEEVASFERAFAIEPEWETDDIQNHQYGWALMRIGEEARARAAFEKMVALGGTKAARGRRSLGILALQRGRIGEASRDLLEAARINETAGNRLSAARDRYYLAESLTLVGRRDAAAGEIRRAERSPEEGRIRAGVAWSASRRPLGPRRATRGGPAIDSDPQAEDRAGREPSGPTCSARKANCCSQSARTNRGSRSSARHTPAGRGISRSRRLPAVSPAPGLLKEAIALHEALIADGPEPWEGHVELGRGAPASRPVVRAGGGHREGAGHVSSAARDLEGRG